MPYSESWSAAMDGTVLLQHIVSLYILFHVEVEVEACIEACVLSNMSIYIY